VKPKFKKRYVLGEGYPQFILYQEAIRLQSAPGKRYFKTLDVPQELWIRRIPKYRLELVRVDKKK